MLTGTKTKVPGTTQYLYSASYYDDKLRLLQTYSHTSTIGVIVNTNQYNFSGGILGSYQTTVTNLNSQTVDIYSKYDYDDLGRLLSVKKDLNSSFGISVGQKTSVKNEYNALGQVKKKSLGDKPAAPGNPLAKLDYEYNIRGWLLSINKSYIDNATNGDQHSGMQLGYDKNGTLSTFIPKYNGNISGTI